MLWVFLVPSPSWVACSLSLSWCVPLLFVLPPMASMWTTTSRRYITNINHDIGNVILTLYSGRKGRGGQGRRGKGHWGSQGRWCCRANQGWGCWTWEQGCCCCWYSLFLHPCCPNLQDPISFLHSHWGHHLSWLLLLVLHFLRQWGVRIGGFVQIVEHVCWVIWKDQIWGCWCGRH